MKGSSVVNVSSQPLVYPTWASPLFHLVQHSKYITMSVDLCTVFALLLLLYLEQQSAIDVRQDASKGDCGAN